MDFPTAQWLEESQSDRNVVNSGLTTDHATLLDNALGQSLNVYRIASPVLVSNPLETEGKDEKTESESGMNEVIGLSANG